MSKITLTNAEVLKSGWGLRFVAASNALASVKLNRIRHGLNGEAQPIILTHDEIGQRHATKDDAGAPVQLTVAAPAPAAKPGEAAPPEPAPIPQFNQFTGRPAYVMTPEAEQAYEAELHDFELLTVEFEAPTLGEKDLASLVVGQPGAPVPDFVALALSPFAVLE